MKNVTVREIIMNTGFTIEKGTECRIVESNEQLDISKIRIGNYDYIVDSCSVEPIK